MAGIACGDEREKKNLLDRAIWACFFILLPLIEAVFT